MQHAFDLHATAFRCVRQVEHFVEQLLYFLTLSIILSFYLKHDVLEAEYSVRNAVLNKKNRMLDNAPKI
jgi:hypothetical protein